jgi:hypothetical protein
VAGEATELDLLSPRRRDFWFKPEGRIVTTPPAGRARWETGALVATVRLKGDPEPKQALVLDASLGGLAFRSFASFQKQDEVELMLNSAVGPIEVHGVVQYCRDLADPPKIFRIGLEVQPKARVDKYRWGQMIERLANKAA